MIMVRIYSTYYALAVILCTGCLHSYDVSPARGRWAVSRSGTQKATISEWAGNLEWRTVFDKNSNKYRVGVLVNVSGLNPWDQVSRSGRILKRRPMPPVVYLTDGNHRMLTEVPGPEGRWGPIWEHYGREIRVYGTMCSNLSGGYVIAPDGKSEPAYVEDPATIPPDEGRWDRSHRLVHLHSAIGPLIFVDKITPMPPDD